MNAGNLFSVGETVVVSRDSLQFKARIIGAVKKQFWPSKYTLELSNGERLVVDEGELSPYEVSAGWNALIYLATLLAMMISIILVSLS